MHNDAWQESHLGDWIKLLSGGTPPKSDASLWGGSIPWISCKDMKVSLLDSSQDWLTEAGASKLRKVPSGTILIVVRGMILANEFPVARCLRDVTFNQDLKAVIPREGLDEGFLFQWLRGNSYEILGRVDEAGHGTKRLQTDRLLSVPLRLPPLPTQRRIASILSAYDDLIENNTKRIEILEEMARSLYREWFVHFRFPGHEKVKLVDSELGKIPEGWDATNLQALVDTGELEIRTGPFGTQLKASDYVENGPVPVINVRNVGFGTIRADKLEFVSKETATRLRQHVLSVGDIAFGRKGAVERHALVRPEQDGWLQGSDCIRLRVLTGRVSPFRLSLQFQMPEHKAWMQNHCSHGATMASLNQRILGAIQLLVPSQSVYENFLKFAKPAANMIAQLDAKDAVLRQTRDLLLPKLISGEIDVDALDLPEELPRSGARRRKGRGKIDGDALDLQETG